MVSEIYEIADLVKLYIYLNLIVTVLGVVSLLIWVIKKRLFKFAFKNHSLWRLEEKVSELDSKIEFTQNFIAERTANFMKQQIEINNQLKLKTKNKNGTTKKN